jgi:hypothetical protein
VLVYGYGPGFERSYGLALENAGFAVVKESPEMDVDADVILVSYLDGEPLRLPQANDPRVNESCVWLSDAQPPEDYPRPTELLQSNTSAEALLFHLGPLVPEGPQRRGSRRRLADFDVRYRVVGVEGPGEERSSQLSNLSLGGAFIRSLDPPEVGERVRLEIELETAQPPLLLDAKVVYRLVADLHVGLLHNPDDPGTAHAGHPGFAVAFDVSSFETRSMLTRELRRLGGEVVEVD